MVIRATTCCTRHKSVQMLQVSWSDWISFKGGLAAYQVHTNWRDLQRLPREQASASYAQMQMFL